MPTGDSLVGDREGTESSGGGDDYPSDEELDLGERDDEHLDGIHGDGGPLPDDGMLTRRWADGSDGRSHDWGNGQWAHHAGVRAEDARTWVSHARASGARLEAAGAAPEGMAGAPILPAEGGQYVPNDKRQLAVDIVVERAQVEIAFREAVARAREDGLPLPEDNRVRTSADGDERHSRNREDRCHSGDAEEGGEAEVSGGGADWKCCLCPSRGAGERICYIHAGKKGCCSRCSCVGVETINQNTAE